MKFIIRNEIYCNYDNIKKYLPAKYIPLVSKNYYMKTINLVCFPSDKISVTSSYIIKAIKKINNKEIPTLYFARCFTLDAIKIINENNGTALDIVEFPWTDERYNEIRGGKK